MEGAARKRERTYLSGVPRIRDQFPAGYVTLAGSFFEGHKETILQLMRNEEERAKAEHPLKRIIDIQTQDLRPSCVRRIYTWRGVLVRLSTAHIKESWRSNIRLMSTWYVFTGRVQAEADRHTATGRRYQRRKDPGVVTDVTP
jgi:hypothetical protein